MKKKYASLWLIVYTLCVMHVWSDAMPISFDSSSSASNMVEKDDFFNLETVDFTTKKKPDNGERKTFSSIALAPAGMAQLVVRRNKDLAREHAASAEEYIKNNDMEKAVGEIDKALLRDPVNMDMVGRAGLIYAAAKHYEEASYMLRVYLQNYPDQVNHLAAWGGVLLRLNDYETAKVMLDRSLLLDPENVMAHYQSEILAQLTNQSLEESRYWPLLEPVRFRMVLGWIQNDREDLERLLGAERISVMCDRIVGPGTVAQLDAINETLDLYAENEKADEKDMQKTIELCGRLEAMGFHNQSIVMAQAQACYETDQMDEAWRIIRNVQEHYPEYQLAWFNGGLIALQTANYEVAEMLFRKALALRQDGVSYFALACAYASLGKTDEAWTILKQLKKTDPEKLTQWLDGDSAYLTAIKQNPRYAEISP